MPPAGSSSSQVCEWVRRVNNRWIVRHGLKERANAYMDHLEASDPERLGRSCERARQLVHSRDPGEDPKPWFYAGLFSLATVGEGREYLADHWFTAACVPCLADTVGAGTAPSHLGAAAKQKLARIREALTRLRQDRTSQP